MQLSSGDPLDWTVDEVVNFLCHNLETPWSKSSSSAPRPNPVSFEASLREHFISGEVLLQDVEKETLRDDLGLKALGHRSSMMMAIRFLQQHSAKFQASKPEQDTVMASPAPLRPLVPITQHTPQASSAHPSPIAQTGSVLGFDPSTPSSNKLPTMTGISDSLAADGSGRVNSIAPGRSADAFSALPRDSPFTSPENILPDPTSLHEETWVYQNGKKRRKLNLSSHVEPPGGGTVAKKSVDIKTKDWYMGPDNLTAEQVFYSPDLEGSDQTFTLVSSKLPTAQRAFVSNSLKYFFQQSPIELNATRGNSQQAIVPYKPSMMKSSRDRFFTLYTTKHGRVSASKEKIEDWPRLLHQLKPDERSKSSHESSKSSDPFSYLLEKYPAEEGLDDAFPVYGDSGSEGEFDEETWQEMEEEQGESTPPQQRKLGPDEIDAVIRDCIAEFEKTWDKTRLPKEEYKARKIWVLAKRGNYANQQIKSTTKDISLLVIRLEKLKGEISKNEYSNQAELRTQCQCLEQTVFNLQKQKWLASVLEQKECPPKVSAPPKPQRAPKPKTGDEESLESETDLSDDDIEDFIIPDAEPLNALPPGYSSTNPSSSDSDGDYISFSGTRHRTRGRVPPVFASSSSSSSSPPRGPHIRKKPDVIDLTRENSEPEDLMIKTPPLNPVGANTKVPDSTLPDMKASNSPPPSSAEDEVHVKSEKALPDVRDMNGLLSLDWGLIRERRDHSRLLAKLLASLSDNERNDMAARIPTYQFSKLKSLASRGLRALINRLQDIPGMEASESRLIMRTTTFYVSWLNCRRLDNKNLVKKGVEAALQKLDDKKYREFDTYYGKLRELLELCQYWKANEAADYPESDSEPVRGPGLGDTPRKKRKREVKESQQAKIDQNSAQRRVMNQEKQKRRFEKQLETMGMSNHNPSNQAVSFGDPVIYLNEHIGERVKPHQLHGIQFMWRELVEDQNEQGCLLAHTMGLGKTMQVISLLTTILEAAESSDPKVEEQVPEKLRRPRTLIICPSSLIANWSDEFVLWSPVIARKVRRVSTTADLPTRLGEVHAWYEGRGILLISYNIFSKWIMNKKPKKREMPLTDSQHQKVRHWLLNGPDIIVADEAHKMKNPKSETSNAAIQFRSKSRIALTGSPLANNLEDYYTMVNWIAEGYLGDPQQFRAHYIEPINDGLYADSDHRERRKCLMKLQVLKRILEPKVDRADISVLKGDLPPKVEFILTVPLTQLQKTAYDTYAASVLQGQTGEVAQTTLWSWLTILGLCCNHPACFREKLITRAENAAKKAAKATTNTSDVDFFDDRAMDDVELPNQDSLTSEQLRLFEQVQDMMAIELSARAAIATRLIDETIAAGDKMLVFSQSIPTLNYIEHLLELKNRRYSRLDGKTPVASRQAATKEFNQGNIQVYLISTKAGGLGLNIPGANRVIIFDFSFSPILEEQAVGRAYRLGQQKPVYVYRFLAGGTFEEIIHHKAIFKSQLSSRVVDKKNPVRYAHKKPGDYLFPAKPVPQDDISAYIGKDRQVLDKILLEDEKRTPEDRLIRKIMLTETFQMEDNDKLTEEEKQAVQEQFDDESLRRSDPEAYAKRMQERQMKELLQHQQPYKQQQAPPNQAPPSTAPFPISVGHGVYHPPPQVAYNAGSFAAQQAIQQSVSSSVHNSGPPALPPDAISRVGNANPNPGPTPPSSAPVASSTHYRSPATVAKQSLKPSHPQPMQISNNDKSGPQHTRPAPLNFDRLQASMNGVVSNPPNPDSPAAAVDASEPKSAEQNGSSRRQSVPPHATLQASDSQPRASSEDHPSQTEEESRAHCRQQ